MGKAKTIEQFIEEAKLIHGDKYDYSLVDYKRNNIKVKIKCNICGNIFEQTPVSHICQKSGCKKCADKNNHEKEKLTIEQFIEKSKKVHGDKYDYSLVDYKNNKTPVQIKCNTCGKIFVRIPKDHYLNNIGCPNCSKLKKLTIEQFIEKSKKVHGDKYDYSLVEYKNNKTKVKIKCNICGNIFKQVPQDHYYKGYGCKKCASNKIINTNFITEFDGKNCREEYIKLIKKSKENPPSGYTEKHHILPKSVFPNWETKLSNLVDLTLEDHYRAHYLLYKIYNNYEMAYALKRMLDVTGRKYNPKLYSDLKSKEIEYRGIKIYCFEEDKEYISFNSFAKTKGLSSVNKISNNCKNKNWEHTSKGFHLCLLKDKDEAKRFWEQFI